MYCLFYFVLFCKQSAYLFNKSVCSEADPELLSNCVKYSMCENIITEHQNVSKLIRGGVGGGSCFGLKRRRLTRQFVGPLHTTTPEQVFCFVHEVAVLKH